jgi:hypothetical protein
MVVEAQAMADPSVAVAHQNLRLIIGLDEVVGRDKAEGGKAEMTITSGMVAAGGRR